VQSANRIKEDMQDVQDRGKKKKKIGNVHGVSLLSFPIHPAYRAYPLPILFFVDYATVSTCDLFISGCGVSPPLW
jgi:hypothetical protein